MTNVLIDRARLRNRAAGALPTRRFGLTIGALAAGMAVAAASTTAQARPAPRSFADLVEKVAPAVVVIKVQRQRSAAGFRPRNLPPNRDFRVRPVPPGTPNLRRFFRNLPRFRTRGVGSGFVVDAAGYIVTNHHVIRNSTRIEVVMHDGKTYQAKLIGHDAKTDLALVKIEAGRKLVAVPWGDSDTARVGDWVMAMGNPFGIGTTVTAGIISARGRNIGGRTIVDYIQVDAAINKGNSGGPTFNLDGQVVGVNTAIYSPNGGSVGVGFAIPSNTAKRVIEQLKTRGKVDRGWLGVQIGSVSQDIAQAIGRSNTDGAIVAMVVPGSPAARGGIRTGDVILRWNGKAVKNHGDLVRKVARTASKSTAQVVVWRDRQELTLSVRVGDLHRANLNRPGTRPGTRPSRPNNSQELGKLGLSVRALTPATRNRAKLNLGETGVEVATVRPDSAAARASLRRGDVITKVDNKSIASAADLRRAVEDARRAGRTGVLVMIRRNGQPAFVGLGL